MSDALDLDPAGVVVLSQLAQPEYVPDWVRERLEGSNQVLVEGTACRCGLTETYGPCLVHPVQNHYYRPIPPATERDGPCALCPYTAAQHRRMTSVEYQLECPLLYDRLFPVGDDWYRLDCRRYWGGPGVCLTRLFEAPGQGDPDDDFAGMSFDFPAELVGPLLLYLRELQTSVHEDHGAR